MNTIIEINGLSKSYKQRKAVDNLSLTVEEGEIFGFVGPNGAGKTSTIRVMATLLEQEAGDIIVCGYSVKTDADKVRKKIGYMPDFFGLYDDMTVWEYLDFFGACYQISPGQRKSLIENLLELVDLSHRIYDPVEKLSRGLKQRLSLARTLIHDPQVLILDEPASGLDPRARAEIRELMRQLSEMGKTIFFSTHILADVSEICSRVAIIEDGQLVALGGLEDLHKNLLPVREIHILLIGNSNSAEEYLSTKEMVNNIKIKRFESEKSSLQFEFNGTDEDVHELLRSMIEAQLPVIHFMEDNRDMEEIFLRATKGIVS